MKLGRLVGWGTALWAFITIAVFMYLLWLQTAQPFHVWRFLNSAGPDQFFNAARTTATLLGVTGLGGAALIAYRRQVSTETTLTDDRTKALHERYGNAAEQLGNDSAAIRLAGVYALASLADDWHAHASAARQRQVCIDLLCAYLRSDAHGAENSATEKDVQAAIVDTIRRRTAISKSNSWSKTPDWHFCKFNLRTTDLTATDFSRSFLVGSDFTTSDLSHANLAYSIFSYDGTIRDRFGEQLEDSMRHKNAGPRAPRPRTNVCRSTLLWTSFSYANMRGADLSATKPRWVTFNNAQMQRADLTLADLTESDFTDANLTNAVLAGAILSSSEITATADEPVTFARFVGATLAGADLNHAYVGRADFTGADLSGANFTLCTGLREATLRGIVYDELTIWPAYFKPPVSLGRVSQT